MTFTLTGPMTPAERRGRCLACGRFFRRIARRERFCRGGCGWVRSGGAARRKPESWRVRPDGYVAGYYWDGDRQVFTSYHRLVMEQALGRRLPHGAIVHHKNGDRTDNRVENLEIMSRGKHARLHSTGRQHTPESIRRMSETAKRNNKVAHFKHGRNTP